MGNKNGVNESTTTLCVPYYYGDPVKDFNYNKDINALEYTNNLIGTYNSYKNTIREAFDSSFGKNMATFIPKDEKENNKYDQQKIYFTETNVNIYDKNGDEMTLDKLIGYFQKETAFVIIINPYKLGNDADLEEDFKKWARETIRVMSIPEDEVFTTAYKINALSTKDLKLKFQDAESTAILQKSRMIDPINNRKFAFMAEKIIFITK